MKRPAIRIGLHWQILIALILSVLYGIFLKEHIQYVSWMGVLFLRALNMTIIPLVLSSIVSGVANIGSAGSLGKLGLKTFGFYLGTSLLAILTGQFLVNTLKPGAGADLNLVQPVDQTPGSRSIWEILYEIIPPNVFSALSDNGRMLAVIFFAILFGFFITQVDQKHGKVLKEFASAVFEVMMKITMFIIRFAPFGIFALVAEKIAMQDDLVSLMESMGFYMVIVMFGILFHLLFSLSLILKFIGRINPWHHLKAMRTPLITAFSTASSNATLPLSIEAVEDKAGVSNKISSFVLPLGATVNMNGTALYECVAVIFIAQAYGIDLTFMQQVTIALTALLAAVGSAGIPMAGLVMMTLIMNAVGLPLEGIGLILAVDRLLDMFRTMLNVYGDTCGAVIIAKSEGEKLLL